MKAETPNDLHAVVERLQKIERENRRLKHAAFAVLTLPAITVLATCNAQPIRTLDTDMLVLRDTQGRLRAELAVRQDEPYLIFYDQEGKEELMMGAYQANAHDPALSFYAGKDRTLKAQVSGSALGVSLASYRADQLQTALSVLATSPVVLFTGPNNGVRLDMDDNGPRLNFVDSDGNTIRSVH